MGISTMIRGTVEGTSNPSPKPQPASSAVARRCDSPVRAKMRSATCRQSPVVVMAVPMISPDSSSQKPPPVKLEKITACGAAPIARNPRNVMNALTGSGNARVANCTSAMPDMAATRGMMSAGPVDRNTSAATRTAAPFRTCAPAPSGQRAPRHGGIQRAPRAAIRASARSSPSSRLFPAPCARPPPDPAACAGRCSRSAPRPRPA